VDGGSRERAPEVRLVGDLADRDDGVGDGCADVCAHHDWNRKWNRQHWKCKQT